MMWAHQLWWIWWIRKTGYWNCRRLGKVGCLLDVSDEKLKEISECHNQLSEKGSSSFVLSLLCEHTCSSVDLSTPNFSVTRSSNTLIRSGKTHLLPLSLHRSSPCLPLPPWTPPTLGCQVRAICGTDSGPYTIHALSCAITLAIQVPHPLSSTANIGLEKSWSCSVDHVTRPAC